MKKHLRLLSAFLALFLCGGVLMACDSGEGKNQPKDDNPTTLTITGDFVITRPANQTDSEKVAANKIYFAMQDLGLTPTVQDDSAAEAKNEILIGQTSRSQSQEALNGLSSGDFTIKVSGDATKGYKIVLAAVSDSGIESATEYFVENYLSGSGAATLPVDLLYNYKCVDVKIAGTPISEYTIVCAPESATVSDNQIQAAKYADTVEVFADEVEKATGVRPSIIDASSRVPEGAKVILFGKTRHADDDSAYTTAFASEGAYTVKLLDNGNVVLAGNNACSVLAAGEAFVAKLRESQSEITELDIAAEKNIIKVACIGDSITFGTNSSDTSMMNYPVYLQRLLGYDYYVEKYGAPSHSLIETDTQSFLKHGYFTQSVNAAPDVVIVMLGTNDCRTQKWSDSAYKDWRDGTRMQSFLAAGEKLINAYRGANEDVQLIWTTCPTVPQDAWLGSDWTDRIERYGNPGIAQIAATHSCNLIDVFTYTEEHPEIFHISDDIPEAERGDGLHPQNETYGILAQGIYDMIKDIIVKPE